MSPNGAACGGCREDGEGRVDDGGRVIHAVRAPAATPSGTAAGRLGVEPVPRAQGRHDDDGDEAPDRRPEDQGEQRELRRFHGLQCRARGDADEAECDLCARAAAATIHSRGTVR